MCRGTQHETRPLCECITLQTSMCVYHIVLHVHINWIIDSLTLVVYMGHAYTNSILFSLPLCGVGSHSGVSRGGQHNARPLSVYCFIFNLYMLSIPLHPIQHAYYFNHRFAAPVGVYHILHTHISFTFSWIPWWDRLPFGSVPRCAAHITTPVCVLQSIHRIYLYVYSFAKEPYKRDDILQKRPVIFRSPLIVAPP